MDKPKTINVAMLIAFSLVNAIIGGIMMLIMAVLGLFGGIQVIHAQYVHAPLLERAGMIGLVGGPVVANGLLLSHIMLPITWMISKKYTYQYMKITLVIVVIVLIGTILWMLTGDPKALISVSNHRFIEYWTYMCVYLAVQWIWIKRSEFIFSIS